MNLRTLIDQVDLVEYVEKYTTLTESGETYRGVCPICKHDNNSEFSIYDHKTFHCWCCGKSGDVIHFIQYMDNVDFYTALEKLADELNVDLFRDPKYKERKEVVQMHMANAIKYHGKVDVVRDYLHSRNINDETIDYFMLGADKKGNVTIPFIDVNGRYVGGAIRRFEGSPKYMNTKNDDVFTKSAFLYNLRGAKDKLTNELFMVEGYFCAMSMHQNDYACVAYNSSQPSKLHLSKIGELYRTYPEMTVILIPDNDGVAYPLLKKVRKNIINYCPNVPFLVLLLPEGIKDVNEFFANHCKEELRLCDKVSLDLMVLRVELNKCSSIQAERKVAEQFAKTVKSNLALIEIGKFLTERWGISEKAIEDFLKVAQSNIQLTDDFKNADTCVQETIKMLSEKSMQYGYAAIDDNVRGGGRKKDVTFIGGYSSARKTWFAIQMAVDAVVRQGKNALFFSMEMSAGALYERVIANMLGRPTDIVDKMLLEGDPLVYRILDKLKEKLYVVDKNGLSISQVDAYVKDANAKLFDGNLDVVFIDYIQYMRGCAEYQILAETAKGMKPLAKDNNVHVVVLSQLNRGSKIWEKPTMADLKGGGDLEASADNIFLLWKPSANPSLMPEEAKIIRNDIMVGIGKARSGSKIEELKLVFDEDTSRIIMPN